MTAPPDDLVARLTKARDEASTTGRARAGRLFDDAADRIATLTAENKALREALRAEWIDQLGINDKSGFMLFECRCGHSWYDVEETHAPGCLAAGAANER